MSTSITRAWSETQSDSVISMSSILVVSLISMAGLYIILGADFVAVVQVLIYAGAVMILMLFAIMFIDGTWGGFIHVGENFITDSRFGFLGTGQPDRAPHRSHEPQQPIYVIRCRLFQMTAIAPVGCVHNQ